MARQTGLIKLSGTLDDITFYEGKGKAGKTEALAKTKSGVSAERIANDPAFVRTRENNSEFGRTASMAKAIRLAFNRFSKGTQAELVRRLRALLELDAVSGRGQRNFEALTEVQFNALAGFQFNPQSKYSEVILGSRPTKSATATLDVPRIDVSAGIINPPQGATDYSMVTVCSVINLADNTIVETISAISPASAIPADLQFPAVANIANTYTIAPVAGQISLVSFGVVFYQTVNGLTYQLNNDAKTPFELVYIAKA